MKHIINLPDDINAEEAIKKITVLNAIQWTLFSWNEKVAATTIQNCWKKVGFIHSSLGNIEQQQNNLVIAEDQESNNSLEEFCHLSNELHLQNAVDNIEHI
jgi:hypothetical protein